MNKYVSFSFVVRNLEDGRESGWIDLVNNTAEEVTAEWNKVVNPMFDWELVDVESNLSFDYYWFQYTNLALLLELKENVLDAIDDNQTLLNVELMLEHQLVSSIEELIEEDIEYVDYTFIESSDGSDDDSTLAYEFIEQFGFPSEMDPYFDYESLGRDLDLDGYIEDIREDNPEYANMLDDMSHYDLGLHYVEDVLGSIDELSKDSKEMHFDYDQYGRDLSFDTYFVSVVKADGEELVGWYL
jgi:hypothetical protein